MRRPNLLTAINLPIRIVVALRTGRERASLRTKFHAPMLRMTINASNPRRFVRLDNGRGERLRVMTRSTALFHVA